MANAPCRDASDSRQFLSPSHRCSSHDRRASGGLDEQREGRAWATVTWPASTCGSPDCSAYSAATDSDSCRDRSAGTDRSLIYSRRAAASLTGAAGGWEPGESTSARVRTYPSGAGSAAWIGASRSCLWIARRDNVLYPTSSKRTVSRSCSIDMTTPLPHSA